MPDLKEHIDRKNLPSHIAIIMDGNGRWARKQGILRVFGHKNAITAVRETIEGAAEIGIQYVTLFAFSTENWQRPAHEVMALMELLVATLRKELPTLMKNNIRLRAIGNTDELPKDCRENLAAAIQATEKNTHTILTLALSYGGRGDIVAAARKIAEQAVAGKLDPETLDEKTFSGFLSTSWMPDPELIIRTSGEMRVSNFLLWELAYSEIFISEKLWPDFTREDLFQAILTYQSRERRFGKTSEQIQPT